MHTSILISASYFKSTKIFKSQVGEARLQLSLTLPSSEVLYQCIDHLEISKKRYL